MEERSVLAMLLYFRPCWDLIKDVLDSDDFSDLGWLIVKQIEFFYQTDPEAQEVDQVILLSRLGRSHASMHDAATQLVTTLEAPVSSPNVALEYVNQRQASLSKRISHAINSGASPMDTASLMAAWQKVNDMGEDALTGASKNFVTQGLSVKDVMSTMSHDKLVPLFPKVLNDALGGGAPPGTHIVLFARPETGKTMFCVNLVSNFIKSGKRALYIGNEDPAAAIKQRIISNLTGLDKSEVADEDDEYVQDLVNQVGSDQLIFAHLHPGTTGTVKALVAEHRPEVVVVDQIRNLRTPRTLTRVEGLEYIAQEMRNIAGEFDCVVVSVTQAGDSADNKLELGMGDVDFSNTGIPASADVMIGLGVNPQMDVNNMRTISLPKNKLTGDHTAINVSVNPRLSEVY